MSGQRTVEERLAALEEAVAALQRRVGGEPPAPAGFERVVGAVTDFEAFEQVLEYGRAFRHEDRPPDEDARP